MRILTSDLLANTPTPIFPPFAEIMFLDLDSLEIARQLTLIDEQTFKDIAFTECFGKA